MPFKKMDPTWKEKWVNALLSDEYEQGQYTLHTYSAYRDGDSYCCLGVLADLLVKEDQADWDSEELDGKDILPTRILKKVGITPSTQSKLAKMNDDEGLDFPAISDFIKESL